MKSNSISNNRPDLLNEWDYEANGDLSPSEITCGVMTKVHWICSKCGHKWEASVYHRCKRKQGCPVCAAKARGKAKALSSAKKNSFHLQYPELAKEWHPTRNGDLTPDGVSVASNKKVYWLCPDCGLEYAATVNHRTNGKTGCPKCSAKVRGDEFSQNAAKKNNFALHFPRLLSEWDYEVNGTLKPENVSLRSNKRVGWICSFCGNKWVQSINKRTQGYSCPKCSKAGTSFSELALLFYLKKEFPDVLHRHKIENMEFDLFIPRINTAIEYDGVFYHNSSRAFEKENKKDAYCVDHGIRLIRIRDPKLQDTQSALRIVCVDEQGAYLTSAIKELLELLSPENLCAVDLIRDTPNIISSYRNIVYENSIAVKYPELLTIWHPTKNLPLTPDRVTMGMHVKIWWICPVCQHDYLQDINHKIHGHGCPICAGKKVAAGVNDLATTHPFLAKQFHPTRNTDYNATEITAGSNKKVWWLCDQCGHEWQSAPGTRKQGVGCPECARRKRMKQNEREE